MAISFSGSAKAESPRPAGSAKSSVMRKTVSTVLFSAFRSPLETAAETFGSALIANACVTLGTSMKSVSAML